LPLFAGDDLERLLHGLKEIGEPAPGRKQRWLLKVESFSRRRWLLVFLVAALAVVASAGSARVSRWNPTSSRWSPGDRRIDTFKAALRDFGSIDYLMVLIEAGRGKAPTSWRTSPTPWPRGSRKARPGAGRGVPVPA